MRRLTLLVPDVCPDGAPYYDNGQPLYAVDPHYLASLKGSERRGYPGDGVLA